MTRLTHAITVHGRVQGVSLRWMIKEKAQALSLVGFVRNTKEGGALIVCRGIPENVQKLCDWLRTHPGASHIERLEIEQINDSDTYTQFGIHYS